MSQTPALYPFSPTLRERLAFDDLAPRRVEYRPRCACGHADTWHHHDHAAGNQPRGRCYVKACRCQKYQGEAWPSRHAFPYHLAVRGKDGSYAFRLGEATTKRPKRRSAISNRAAFNRMKPWKFRPSSERKYP